MKLIIVHGPPASGKLSISKEMAARLGFAVMHNHLTVDLAMTVYPDFGAGDFFEFVDSLRMSCILKACENEIQGLIVTICYDVDHDVVSVNNWIQVVEKYKGQVVPIYLEVSPDILAHRVSSLTRVGSQKIQSKNVLSECLTKYNFGPIPYHSTITLNTSSLTVSESVEKLFYILANN